MADIEFDEYTPQPTPQTGNEALERYINEELWRIKTALDALRDAVNDLMP